MLGGSILTPTGSPLSVAFSLSRSGSARFGSRFGSFLGGSPAGRARAVSFLGLSATRTTAPCGSVDRVADARNVRSNLHFVRFEALRPVVANPSRACFLPSCRPLPMLGGFHLDPYGVAFICGFQPVPFGFGSVRLSVRFFPWGFPCGSRPCGIVSRLVCHSNYCALRLRRSSGRRSRNVRSNLHFVRFEALRPVVANPSRACFLPSCRPLPMLGGSILTPTGSPLSVGYFVPTPRLRCNGSDFRVSSDNCVSSSPISRNMPKGSA